MACGKVVKGRRRSAEVWINDVWVPFHLKHQNFYKKWNGDRRDVSRMASRASNILKHISLSKGDKVKRYSPQRNFDHTKVQANTFFAEFVSAKKSVSVNATGSAHDPMRPSRELVDACYANIASDSHGRLLSKAPLKVGAVPTILTRPAPQTIMGACALGEDMRIDLSSSVIVSGGWTGAKKQFIKFTDGKFRINTRFNNRLADIDGLNNRISLVEALPTPRKAHIHYMPFRGTSLPGGDLTNSFRTKGEAWSTACMTANRMWDHIHRSPMPNCSIYTTGGREKVSVGKQCGERLQSRLVIQQDQVEFALSKPYVRNIEQYMFNDLLSPITIGRSSTGDRVHTLLQKMSWYKHGMEFDWSGYDASINAQFIIAAFAFLRSLFEESTAIDNAFVYFCHGFLEKSIVTPDGNTFLVRRGMPSGTSWTTIVNSVVNALLMEDMGTRYGPFRNKNFDYIVAGDDGVMFWEDKVSFNPKRLAEWVKRRVDMDLTVIRVGAPIAKHPNKSLTFNKKCYYRTAEGIVATVQPKLLAKRLFPIAHESQSFTNLSNTLGSQIYDQIGHPDCARVLNVASACIHYGMFGHIYGDIGLSAAMVQDELYNSARDATIYENDVYSADKTHPLMDESIWLNKPKMHVVENWMQDNLYKSRIRCDLNSRLRWFTAKLGRPSSVCALWSLMQRERINPERFGVPQKDIDFIWGVWKYWFGGEPSTYDLRRLQT